MDVFESNDEATTIDYDAFDKNSLFEYGYCTELLLQLLNTKEDFDYLESLGIDIESYFMKMSDGTWKLIGDAEAFANLVNGYGIDELLK
mgnify:CR=1 FL=1